MQQCKLLLLLLLLLVLAVARATGTRVFWQVSDTHFDPAYVATGEPDAPNYCHEGGVLPAAPLGRFGCDAPEQLIQSGLAFAAATQPAPKFVLLTGDLAGHGLDISTAQKAYQRVASLARAAFAPDVPVLPLIGNNDVVPHYTMQCGPWDQLDVLAETIAQYVGQDQLATLRRGGYYVYDLSDMRVVALNTLVYSTRRPRVTVRDGDPCGQLAWLDMQLAQARQDGKPVLLAGHIAPGSEGEMSSVHNEWYDDYEVSYASLISSYPDVIAGQVFGHTHNDAFRLLRNQHGTAIGVGLLAPSLSPVFGNHPGMRLGHLSDDTGRALVDMTDYVLDVFAAIHAPHAAVTWQKLYTWSEAFPDAPLTPSGMAALADAFLVDLQVFARWRSFRFGLASPERAHLYCSVSVASQDQFHACVDAMHEISGVGVSPDMLD